MKRIWTVDEEAKRLHERFDSLKTEKSIGQAEFARLFKVPGGASMVSQNIKARRPINLEAATAYANGFGCLLSEISPRLAMKVMEAEKVNTSHQSTSPTGKDADLVIPQYEAGGGMGRGLILEDKQPGLIKSWHVDREWLSLNVPHHTGVKNLCIVTGFGPSMKPKYNPGDPLLLDRGVTVVETEGIYFFRVGKHGFIKQLQRIPTEDGMIIRAKSLNKDYDPFDISERMDFEVFGKVLTVWRSEQV
jgi:hypothetical protein